MYDREALGGDHRTVSGVGCRHARLKIRTGMSLDFVCSACERPGDSPPP